MEAEVSQQQLAERKQYLWSVTQISLASYIAGPVGGCYFLGRNYQALGQLEYSKKCYVAGISGVILLLSIIFLIPEDLMASIPPIVFPLAYTSLISSFAHTYQKGVIEAKLAEGSRQFSYWWLFIVTISLLVIQVPLFFFFSSLFDIIIG